MLKLDCRAVKEQRGNGRSDPSSSWPWLCPGLCRSHQMPVYIMPGEHKGRRKWQGYPAVRAGKMDMPSLGPLLGLSTQCQAVKASGLSQCLSECRKTAQEDGTQDAMEVHFMVVCECLWDQ